jgi:signal transduction histidine kinase
MHQKAFNSPNAKINDASNFIDPLTSVRLVSELLRDYPDLKDSERRNFIDLILSSTDRMIQMVGQMVQAPN